MYSHIITHDAGQNDIVRFYCSEPCAVLCTVTRANFGSCYQLPLPTMPEEPYRAQAGPGFVPGGPDCVEWFSPARMQRPGLPITFQVPSGCVMIILLTESFTPPTCDFR